MPPLPTAIVAILLPFAPLFTAPTWVHAQVLLVGTRLAHGPRTVAAALRALGQERRFERDHRVLNRARWSGLGGAQILLGQLIVLLPPTWVLVIAVDETLERRKGACIAAKGMYRAAVRSSRRQVVTWLQFKPHATFSDCLALVRRTCWAAANLVKSTSDPDSLVISRQDWQRVLDQLASTP